MRRIVFAGCLLTWFAAGLPSQAETPFVEPPRATTVLASSAREGRYAFVMFWKQVDPKTDAMAAAVETGLQPHARQAVFTTAQVSDPADAPLVKQFGLSRAPLPLVLAVAPNGAVTGVFNSPPDASAIEKSFVTPTMAACMKSLQEGKIVVMCADPTGSVEPPLGVRQFLGDPQYDGRLALIRLATAAPAEDRLLKELQIPPQDPATHVVVMAPPGVLIGKFDGAVTHTAIATKLHAAGKCCDDENCKHNHKHAPAK